MTDDNDNLPRFDSRVYEGLVSESAARGSVILAARNGTSLGSPLVLGASDADQGVNGLLFYSLWDRKAGQFFTVDSNTGEVFHDEDLVDDGR